MIGFGAVDRREALRDMRQDQPQAKPLTEFDGHLDRRASLLAIGHATDDRSLHRSSFVRC
jgi:hypothetical protein